MAVTQCERLSTTIYRTEHSLLESTNGNKGRGCELKTLEEHDKEQIDRHQDLWRKSEPHPNGIECPRCELELWDTTPNVVLMTRPPMVDIHCPACGYKGYRIA